MADPVDSLATEPSEPPSPRWHGTLDTITDSERRALRPIGTSAHEVAARTSRLLAALLDMPSVRVFQGIHPETEGVQPIAHAISVGHRIMLVESVAWPPGRYRTAAEGRIHCDGVYIGQSVRPLIAAVCHWREKLPSGHEVSAVVVVHPTGRGDLVLPDAIPGDLAWTLADGAEDDIRACLPAGCVPVSMKALAALIQATALW